MEKYLNEFLMFLNNSQFEETYLCRNNSLTINYQKYDNILKGVLLYNIDDFTDIAPITEFLYLELFEFIKKNMKYAISRIWNYVPEIFTLYESFNQGRFNAFCKHYKSNSYTWEIPAATAVGSDGKYLKIEFLAFQNNVKFIENINQNPAISYSNKYGKTPPVFSRGVIFQHNNYLQLFSSGTSSIKGEITYYENIIYNQVNLTIENLRILGSKNNLIQYGIEEEFSLKDIKYMKVYFQDRNDLKFLKQYIIHIIPNVYKVEFKCTDICRRELLVEIEALFILKI
ncbi:MAG: hypothetical protein WC879_10355 [Melioribacteraceae bacterium]